MKRASVLTEGAGVLTGVAALILGLGHAQAHEAIRSTSPTTVLTRPLDSKAVFVRVGADSRALLTLELPRAFTLEGSLWSSAECAAGFRPRFTLEVLESGGQVRPVALQDRGAQPIQTHGVRGLERASYRTERIGGGTLRLTVNNAGGPAGWILFNLSGHEGRASSASGSSAVAEFNRCAL